MKKTCDDCKYDKIHPMCKTFQEMESRDFDCDFYHESLESIFRKVLPEELVNKFPIEPLYLV